MSCSDTKTNLFGNAENLELDRNVDRIIKTLMQGNTDFYEFYQSRDYMMLSHKYDAFSKRFLSGIQFKLDGDIDSMHWGSMNKMTLIVCLSDKPSITTTFTVTVIVPEHLRDDVLNRIKVDTRVGLTVVYDSFEFNHVFRLVSIDPVSTKLKFKYCICSDKSCNMNFGVGEVDREEHCPICGSPTMLVEDIWEYLKCQNKSSL